GGGGDRGEGVAGGVAAGAGAARPRGAAGGEVLGRGGGPPHHLRRAAPARRHRRGRRLSDPSLLPVVEGPRADPRLGRPAAGAAPRGDRGGTPSRPAPALA